MVLLAPVMGRTWMRSFWHGLTVSLRAPFWLQPGSVIRPPSMPPWRRRWRSMIEGDRVVRTLRAVVASSPRTAGAVVSSRPSELGGSAASSGGHTALTRAASVEVREPVARATRRRANACSWAAVSGTFRCCCDEGGGSGLPCAGA